MCVRTEQISILEVMILVEADVPNFWLKSGKRHEGTVDQNSQESRCKY